MHAGVAVHGVSSAFLVLQGPVQAHWSSQPQAIQRFHGAVQRAKGMPLFHLV